MTQQINLLDPALLPQHDWCNGRFILGMGALLAIVIGGQSAYEQQAMSRLLANSTMAAPAEASTAAIDGEIAELKGQLASSEALLRAAGGLSELPKDNATRVQALIDAMPQNLWLDEVEFGINQRVRISGGVGDAGGLAAFSRRLGEAQAYSGLPLRVVALEPQDSELAERRDKSVTLNAPPVNAAFHFVLSSTDSTGLTSGATN